MKTKAFSSIWLWLAGCGLFFASCSGDDYAETDIRPGNMQKISFEMVYASVTAVLSADDTRVSTSTDGNYTSAWTDGDEVGVYIVKGNGGLQLSGNWVDNAKMTYNNGNWTYIFPSGKEYYPTDGDNLHFYAYYPYNSGVTDALNMSISGLTDQSSAANLSKSDLLSAFTPNVGKSSAPVQLVFTHALAMVELSVTSGGAWAQMSNGVAVTLEGCKPDVSFNLSTGAAGASGSVKSVKMYRVEQSTDANYLTKYTYRALVPTQTVSAGAELFRFSQTQGSTTRTLSHSLTSAVALSSGQVKPYTITLQPSFDPNHAYAVGDYYPYKGFPILGVVFETSNGGKNGKVVDLDFVQRYVYVNGTQYGIKWGDPTVDEYAAGVVGIRDYYDGYSGTRNLIIKRRDQPNFADTYCLFNWIYQTKNNGNVDGMWYLPAINEMFILHTQLIGGLSAIIESSGGRALLTIYYSRVLTENNMANAYYVNNNIAATPYTKEGANYNSVTVAIAKF